MKKKDAIELLGGSAKAAAKEMGFKSVQAIYLWPDPLTREFEDRVNGVLFKRLQRQGGATISTIKSKLLLLQHDLKKMEEMLNIASDCDENASAQLPNEHKN